MPDIRDSRFAFVANVVESVIVLMTVGLSCWLSTIVIEHGKQLSAQQALADVNSRRLDRIEQGGSTSLIAHVKDDDTRVAEIKDRLSKVETAVIALQSAPGKLEAINVRLDGLKEGQAEVKIVMDRMQKTLDEHMKKP